MFLHFLKVYEHVETCALQVQFLKCLQGWRRWRILFISHKIVIRVVILLPGRGGILLNVLGKYPNLLNGVGDGLEDVEEFLCRLYKSQAADSSVDQARACMVDRKKVMLKDVTFYIEVHLSCANYQANVLLQADNVAMNVNPPTSEMEWQRTAEGLQIVWNRLESVPSKSVELVTCGCESKCKTEACKCFKSG